MQFRNTFVPKPDFLLFNRLTNEYISGDLINEDEIDGKKFYVMKIGARVLKLSKDAYVPKKSR